jgi:hypothetical protein
MTPAERETMSAALEIATRGLSETEAYHVGMVIWDMCRYRDKPLERLQEEGLEGPNLREMANIIPVTDYHDGTLMLVHLKPHEGADPDKPRPRPTIEEFVIEDEAIGNVEFGVVFAKVVLGLRLLPFAVSAH